MAQSNGWINPEEKLPEDGAEVLVLASGVIMDFVLTHTYMLGTYSKDEGFTLIDDEPRVANPIVEWWRPLPEAPEGFGC